MRRSRSYSHDCGLSCEAVSSARNLSDQATIGRNSNWSYSAISTAIATTAQPTAAKLRWAIASARYDPMPGNSRVWSPTLIASEATTKNQPPDMDIIMFQISEGVAYGASSRQKRCQALSPKPRDTSSRSRGTLRSDW
ncbi:hypothetical protein NB705_001207 [Xanthomonas sacchari]|nr:hypothetical protein [Xanthomonas sacchari]